MEKEERRRKIEYGRAKLALYRQRKARRDGQTAKKTKKISVYKQDEHTSNIKEGTDELFKNDCEGTDPEWTPDATEMRVLASVQTENPHEVLVEASETLQSSTHSSAPAELVLLEQQVHDQQQLLEQQYHLLKDSQKNEEELKNEVTFLKEKLKEQDKKLDHANNTLLKKQALIDDLHERKTEEEKKSAVLQNQLKSADKLVADFREQLIVKHQENQNLKLELASSKEKESHYLLEIKDLQQKNYKVNITNTGTEKSTEIEVFSEVSFLPESEESKEHDKHLLGVESLVNTLQQQLKPTEVHYGAEILCLQGSLQTTHGLSAQMSAESVTLPQCDTQERPYSGNCLHEHNLGITESYEFETAIKTRDSIITRLAAHMQQSRKETDQILEEFFQLTEGSGKVQIHDQHVSKTLQSSTHSSAAEELVLLKKQVYDQQQLPEQQYHLLKDSQKKEEELKNEVTSLQVHEMSTENPTAMECLPKAYKRNVLPLNAHNNGREEIGTGDKQMNTSRQSVCLPPGGYLQPDRSIQFDALEKCFIQ